MNVNHAVLESGVVVFHPKIGKNFKGTLNIKTYPGLKMRLESRGMVISLNNCHILVPFHKFDCIEITDESLT
jgi:hypothetical protein